MNDHIIKTKPLTPLKYNSKYNYTFLDDFKEYYDVDYFYNLLEYINYKNIINYIHLNWIIINKGIHKDNIINKIYRCDDNEFNEILNVFINKEYSMSIFTINLILRYMS